MATRLATERSEDAAFDFSSACQNTPEGRLYWQVSFGLSALQRVDMALLESDETL
jgi:hypothetical protein